MTVTVRPASKDDAAYVGAHLRHEDEREVVTTLGLPGSVVVPMSFDVSRECFAVFCGNSEQPCAVFGVADDPRSNYGAVWLLATDEIRKCALSFIPWAKLYLRHMARLYKAGLHAYADQRNALHIRWAKLVGCINDGTRLHAGHRFTHLIYKPPHV